MGNEHFKRNVSSKVLVNLWTANVGENDPINILFKSWDQNYQVQI